MTKAYHGGKFFKAIGEKFDNLDKKNDIINADVLDAWFEPSPKITSKILNNLNFSIKTSPPTHCNGLIETISEKRGIKKNNILVGGGSSDLMFALIPNLIKEESKVLILDPMYGEYNHILTNLLSNLDVTHYLLDPHMDFKINGHNFQKAILKVDYVIIVNPNSPTGKYFNNSDLFKIIKENTNTTFIIDETYIDYVGIDNALDNKAEKVNNLIVIKSLSKVFALSGLRVGYMVMGDELYNKIEKFIPPWAVSLPGQIAGIEALNDYAYYFKKYEKTHKLRKEMEENYKKIKKIRVFEGCANYIFISLKGSGVKSTKITEYLNSKNIYIRDCSSWGKSLSEDYIRISVKNKDINNFVYQNFTNAFNKLKKN